MLTSPLLKKNADLYVFLPILYTVWSDAVLTPSEIATLQGLIESQDWLNKEERSFLLEQINPASPPSPDEFIAWRELISKVTNGSTGNSLVELGMKLAALHGDGTISLKLEKEKTSLAKIENTLGLSVMKPPTVFNPLMPPSRPRRQPKRILTRMNSLKYWMEKMQPSSAK